MLQGKQHPPGIRLVHTLSSLVKHDSMMCLLGAEQGVGQPAEAVSAHGGHPEEPGRLPTLLRLR